MRQLTAETLSEAFTLCSQHGGYKVCILFDDRNRLKEFVNDLLNKIHFKEMGDVPGVIHTIQSNSAASFRFYNGSVITIYCISEHNPPPRGVKCNNVLISTVRELTEDEMIYISQMERTYHMSEEQGLRDAVLFATEFGARSVVKRIKDEMEQSPPQDWFKPAEDESSEELDKFLDGFKVSENRE